MMVELLTTTYQLYIDAKEVLYTSRSNIETAEGIAKCTIAFKPPYKSCTFLDFECTFEDWKRFMQGVSESK
jgi:hypothetical protein